MSSNNATTTTLGAHVNFFDSQDEKFDVDREPKDPTKPEHDTEDADDDRELATVDEMLHRGKNHDQVSGVNRYQWVAGSILRGFGNPPIFCPECWHEFDAEIELSDPEHYVPYIEVDHEFDPESLGDSLEVQKNDHRRHRHCPNCGAVSFGGVLGDRDKDTFEEIVEYTLDAVDELVMSRREKLVEAALERKERGESDQSNMEQLIRDLRTEG